MTPYPAIFTSFFIWKKFVDILIIINTWRRSPRIRLYFGSFEHFKGSNLFRKKKKKKRSTKISLLTRNNNHSHLKESAKVHAKVKLIARERERMYAKVKERVKNIYNHPHLKKESVKAHAKVKLIARERECMRKLKRDITKLKPIYLIIPRDIFYYQIYLIRWIQWVYWIYLGTGYIKNP